jgi:hypothetical protein
LMNLSMSRSGKLVWHSPHTSRSFSFSTTIKKNIDHIRYVKPI